MRSPIRRLVDVLPSDQVASVLRAKAARHYAKAAEMLTDLAAEAADRQRQQAANADRAARRERLKKAGILPPK